VALASRASAVGWEPRVSRQEPVPAAVCDTRAASCRRSRGRSQNAPGDSPAPSQRKFSTSIRSLPSGSKSAQSRLRWSGNTAMPKGCVSSVAILTVFPSAKRWKSIRNSFAAAAAGVGLEYNRCHPRQRRSWPTSRASPRSRLPRRRRPAHATNWSCCPLSVHQFVH